jgi:hypothetical protein
VLLKRNQNAWRKKSTTQDCNGRQKERAFRPFSRAPDDIGPQAATRSYCARKRQQGGANNGIENAKELAACAKRSSRTMRRLEWTMRQRKEKQRQHAPSDEKTDASLRQQNEHGGKYDPEKVEFQAAAHSELLHLSIKQESAPAGALSC